MSLVKARDLTQHSRPCHILSPASLSPHSHTVQRLLLVISISSVQATPDLHRDTQDGPDTADHKLLPNDKTSDHFQKSSLGKNFTPLLSTAEILLDVSLIEMASTINQR